MTARAMMQKVMIRMTYDPLRSEVPHEFFDTDRIIEVPVDAFSTFSAVLRDLW